MLRVSYVYRATVVSVHDGDTLTLDVDLGFYVIVRQSCRLLGINAAELGTTSGNAAREYLSELLPAGSPVTVASVKPDKYGGRFLGDVMIEQGHVDVLLMRAGLAVPWNGRGERPVPQ